MKGLEVDGLAIISNNCWGGTICESYGMLKDTSMVGMFISRVTSCCSAPIWTDICRAAGVHRVRGVQVKGRPRFERQLGSPFRRQGRRRGAAHAASPRRDNRPVQVGEPRETGRPWQADFKMNDKNGVTEEDLMAFDALPLERKLVFAAKEHPGVRCCRCIQRSAGQRVHSNLVGTLWCEPLVQRD